LHCTGAAASLFAGIAVFLTGARAATLAVEIFYRSSFGKESLQMAENGDDKTITVQSQGVTIPFFAPAEGLSLQVMFYM
jgi:phosphopantothenate synthetase